MKRFLSFVLPVILILGLLNPVLAMDYAKVTIEPHQCDMSVVLMKDGYTVSDISQVDGIPTDPLGPWNDPVDFFYYFTKLRSGPNPDGYGLSYYKDGENFIDWDTQRWITQYQYSTDPKPLEDAKSAIMNPDNNAAIILAHTRYGQSGHIGNHPFVTNWNGTTFSLLENGWHLDVFKRSMYDYLYYHAAGSDLPVGQWFVDNPPCNGNDASDIDTFNGSNLVLDLIVNKIIANDGDVLWGIFEAYTSTSKNPSGGLMDYYDLWKNHNVANENGCNLIFSDGESIWAYRSTLDALLSYKDFGDWVGIKTQDTIEGGRQIPLYSLMQFKRNGEIIEYENFLDSKKRVDENDYSVALNGSWANLSDLNCFEGTEKYSNNVGDYCELTFNGTEILVYGTKGTSHGKFDVYIDGVLDTADVDTYNSTGTVYQQLIYSKKGLEPGSHTIKLVVNGNTDPAATDSFIFIDKFVFTPSSSGDQSADEVIEKINLIPATVTLADKTKVMEARMAYDKLTSDQKVLVTDIARLVAAESKIAELERKNGGDSSNVILWISLGGVSAVILGLGIYVYQKRKNKAR